MVVFSSLEFLFRFLPIFLVIYYITPSKYKNVMLLLGSIVFYAVGEPYYVILLMAAISINSILAKKIITYDTDHKWMMRKRRYFFVLALLFDAGLLVVFKALGAFDLLGVLPLGISFFTFKMISFQVDVYDRDIVQMPSFEKTASYFAMFPQVVSGPIMRYSESEFDENKRINTWEKREEGLQYFIFGMGMKILVADRLALLWNDISTIGYESISTPLAWLGAAGFSMQLYFDFWGYSLMAAGLCMMLGFSFIRNFDHPYASKSISEFWRRWHITLGGFFRDYVYIPLGGSRVSTVKVLRNLFVVWLLTGLWHGGSINFIVWGLLLFAFIMLEKLFLGKWLYKVPVLGHFYVLFLIPITWIVFAITDLEQLFLYLGRMFPIFGGAGIVVNGNDFQKHIGMYGIYLAAGLILCIPCVYRFFEKHRKHPAFVTLTVVVFWLSVYRITIAGNNPFMYLQF